MENCTEWFTGHMPLSAYEGQRESSAWMCIMYLIRPPIWRRLEIDRHFPSICPKDPGNSTRNALESQAHSEGRQHKDMAWEGVSKMLIISISPRFWHLKLQGSPFKLQESVSCVLRMT